MGLKQKNFLINLSLSLISIIVFLILCELVTRLFWDPEIQNRKSIIIKEKNRTVNYENIEYKTNSYGIREEEISIDKAKNEYRILALGDSFIWGDGLTYDQLVTSKIEKLLNQRDKSKVYQVINTGIGGFNTKNEYDQLVRLTPIYKPDMAILFFFTNDLLETDSLGNTISSIQNIKEYLRAHSKFFAYLYYLYRTKIIYTIGTPSEILPREYFDFSNQNKGWINFKSALLNIKNFCYDNKIDLVFVFIPTLTDLGENYPYEKMFNSVKNEVISKNIPFINLRIPLQKFSPEYLWINLENVHWNDTATTISAKYIVDNLFQTTP